MFSGVTAGWCECYETTALADHREFFSGTTPPEPEPQMQPESASALRTATLLDILKAVALTALSL
jgi:hypothetical protein